LGALIESGGERRGERRQFWELRCLTTNIGGVRHWCRLCCAIARTENFQVRKTALKRPVDTTAAEVRNRKHPILILSTNSSGVISEPMQRYKCETLAVPKTRFTDKCAVTLLQLPELREHDNKDSMPASPLPLSPPQSSELGGPSQYHQTFVQLWQDFKYP
jgi:hypothetical protein